MAGASSRSKFTTKQFSYDIFFDGALLSNTRGFLVIELIKYFLYERQQIPLPVDELNHQVAQQENLNLRAQEVNDEGNLQSKLHTPGFFKSRVEHNVPLTNLTNVDASCTNTQCDPVSHNGGLVFSKNLSKTTAPHIKCSQDRKAKSLVHELAKLFESLHKAFESCPEIEQVAVILGGTVMNPKESFIINFPPPCPEADSIPFLSCKRALFQQIISEDILGTMSANMLPTNMMIMVSAPRSYPLKGFLPKQFMRAPKSGAVISFNFHCNYVLPVCYDLTFVSGDFELSGIEPLDTHGKDRTTPLDKSLQLDNGEYDKSRTKCLHGKACGEKCPNIDCDFHINSGLANMKISSGSENLSASGQSLDFKLVCQIRASPAINMGSPITDSENGTDCIWYQSPFVVKGYRIQDRQNSLMCS